MRIPRDVDARNLIKVLERYGYIFRRQEGSHIRMSKIIADKVHNITIPNHNPLKIGTLQRIAKEICIFNDVDASEFYSWL